MLVGCTVENQERADYRLPIFRSLPIRHKSIIAAPLLERIDLEPYLDRSIEEVSVVNRAFGPAPATTIGF